MAETMMVYTAIYDDVNAALADLDALEQLHRDGVVGKYDAAVIDKDNGEPHIVKRMDRPRARVIPEVVGKGTLPRHDLHDAAQELTAQEAALIVIGEPTLEKGFDTAVTSAARTMKRDFNLATDELASELHEALKH